MAASEDATTLAPVELRTLLAEYKKSKAKADQALLRELANLPDDLAADDAAYSRSYISAVSDAPPPPRPAPAHERMSA